jgi:hypothetical protein
MSSSSVSIPKISKKQIAAAAAAAASPASEPAVAAPATISSLTEPSENKMSLKKKKRVMDRWDPMIQRVRDVQLKHIKESKEYKHVQKVVLKSEALKTISGLINELFRRYREDFNDLLQRRHPGKPAGTTALSLRDIVHSTNLIFKNPGGKDGPRSMLRLCLLAGAKAVARYEENKTKFKEMSSKNVTATETKSKTQRAPMKTALAETQFSVNRVLHRLRMMRLANSYRPKAAVFLTGLLDEVFGIFMQQTILNTIRRFRGRSDKAVGAQIRNTHIQQTMQQDIMWKKLFPGNVSKGGVNGIIQPSLLPPVWRKRAREYYNDFAEKNGQSRKSAQGSQRGDDMDINSPTLYSKDLAKDLRSWSQHHKLKTSSKGSQKPRSKKAASSSSSSSEEEHKESPVVVVTAPNKRAKKA